MVLMEVNSDAWSHGQTESKLWLCKELEEHHAYYLPKHIAIYGGWYGLSAFLLLSRGYLEIVKIRSYDIDPACEPVADKINNAWELDDWKFKAHTLDCNDLIWSEDAEWMPNIIINTSTEHFKEDTWWENIPHNMFVVLQGTDMEGDDHHSPCASLNEFKERFPVQQSFYAGTKIFKYPDKTFRRFMIVGKK